MHSESLGVFDLARGSLWIALAVLPIGCTPPPDDGGPTGRPSFDEFFVQTQSTSEVVPAGGQRSLPAGGALIIPTSAGSGSGVTVAEGTLTPGAEDAFSQEYPGTTLAGQVLQIRIEPTGATPDHVILRLPASDPTARIYVAGYVDEDTSSPDWSPVRGSYDAGTGMVTAAVGLQRFGPAPSDAGVQKGAIQLNSAGSTTYVGYVAVVVGGEPFQSQIIFIAQEPTEPLIVQFDGPPIAVRARVGLSLTGITHPPLDTLTVTSDFGPRPQPAPGASTNHRGVDYRAANGTTVYAAGDGRVIRASCDLASVRDPVTNVCGRSVPTPSCPNGCITGGYIVVIDHGHGVVTRYLHMTEPAFVNVGDQVSGGQPIGLSDSTGGVNAHLHYEVRSNGTPVDPELFNEDNGFATIAMALDFQIQEGTQQQVAVTRGIIEPQDLAEYVSVFELAGVAPGEHKLQFVALEPNGVFEILYEVPLINVDLNGRWIDHGTEDREVTITQAGGNVSTVYVEPYVCDHRDGQGTTSETSDDFVGTLDGMVVTGTIKVCSFGCEAGDPSCPPNGITDAAVMLTANPGMDLLDGFWLDRDGNERSASFTRLEDQ